MWRKQGGVVYSKPWRFHHTGAHSCSNKGAEAPKNSVVLSVCYFYFAISLATQWFIFHGLQVLWSKDWAAFSPKLCQTQNAEKIWTVTGKGHWLVLDGHTSAGHVNKSVSLSDFRAPNILPKHTLKARANIENQFYIASYFFSSAFPHSRFPVSASAACFHSSLGPQFLACQSFLAPKHNHVRQSLVLPEL